MAQGAVTRFAAFRFPGRKMWSAALPQSLQSAVAGIVRKNQMAENGMQIWPRMFIGMEE